MQLVKIIGQAGRSSDAGHHGHPGLAYSLDSIRAIIEVYYLI